MKYLNRAATIVQDDVYVLTLRAHAKVGCQDYEGALVDANKVIDIQYFNDSKYIFYLFPKVLSFLREPDNPGALIAQGDAFYFLGKFEHALVSYSRAQVAGNTFVHYWRNKVGHIEYGLKSML